MDRFLGRIFARKHIALVGAAVMAAHCSSVLAQDRETWRCDTPNGRYDVTTLSISDQTTSISGRINVHKADAGQRWGSTAKIVFQDSKPTDGDCGCNGLLIKAFHNPDMIEFYMLVRGEEVAVLSGRNYETAVTFNLSIDPRGVMTARIGKEHVDTKAVPLIHPAHDTIRMFCSGTDVSFLNVAAQ